MKGSYVDGFLLVVPKNKIAEYKKMAVLGKKMWLKHGALDYKECKEDDLQPQNIPGMKFRSFTDVAKAKSDEAVWFSFIVFKSKKHRDTVNAKVMKEMDKEMEKYKDKPMPFDMKRFSYGGFKVEVGK
jgi:alkaline phosphatase